MCAEYFEDGCLEKEELFPFFGPSLFLCHPCILLFLVQGEPEDIAMEKCRLAAKAVGSAGAQGQPARQLEERERGGKGGG